MSFNTLPSKPAGNSISAPAYAEDSVVKRVVDSCRATVVWRPTGGGSAEALRVPTAAERKMLETRLTQLQVIGRGIDGDADKRRAAKSVASMLDGFTRGRSLTDAEKQGMIAAFVFDLQDLPAWAIERACERIRRGEVEGMSFNWMPTSAFLHKAAAAEMAPLRAEERRIQEALALQPRAKSLPEAERARVAEKFKALRAEMKARAAADDRTRHDETVGQRALANSVRRIENEWARQAVSAPMIGGVPISRELAAQLNLDAPNAGDASPREMRQGTKVIGQRC